MLCQLHSLAEQVSKLVSIPLKYNYFLLFNRYFKGSVFISNSKLRKKREPEYQQIP